MRHRRKGARLGRTSHKLKALLRSLVTSLVLNGQMVTTEAKAKALIPLFDRLVIKARNESKMIAIRDLKKVLFGEAAQRQFMEVVIPQLEGRTSGFTSALKIGFRRGDNAPTVRIEICSAERQQAKKDAKAAAKNTKVEAVAPAVEKEVKAEKTEA